MSASQPWMKFYPQDWRADEKLRMCGLAARGLWIEMLAIMHRSERYGQLLIAGSSPTEAQLAVQVGASTPEVSEMIGQLEAAGVFSRTGSGVIYSRRMTRDNRKANIARKNGKSGGNPSLLKQTGNPASDKPPVKGGVKPQIPEARDQKKREDKPLSPRAIPDWLPMEEWRGFRAMRAKIKKPLTDRAATMAIRNLAELRDAGQDPAAVLDQSTLHCWQDLYPVSERTKGGTYDPERITV